MYVSPGARCQRWTSPVILNPGRRRDGDCDVCGCSCGWAAKGAAARMFVDARCVVGVGEARMYAYSDKTEVWCA